LDPYRFPHTLNIYPPNGEKQNIPARFFRHRNDILIFCSLRSTESFQQLLHNYLSFLIDFIKVNSDWKS
jgi:hypothetical protein